MHQLGLSFTFKRENFSPAMYLKNTCGDLFDVVYFKDDIPPYILNDIERYHFTVEEDYGNYYYIINDFEFLKEFLYSLREMKEKLEDITKDGADSTYQVERFKRTIERNIYNLEWLMHYYSNTIAASELFNKLTDDCFDVGSPRDQWISMCKAWGNEKPKNFELILWTDRPY